MSALVWLAASVLLGVAATRLVLRGVARTRWRRVLRGPGWAVQRPTGPLIPWRDWSATPVRRRTAVGLTALGASAVAAAAAGPVAAVVGAVYAGLLVHLRARAIARGARIRSYRAAIESVAGLAAELRAGQSVGSALAAASALRAPAEGEMAVRVVERVTAAVDLAESSGAPLADVLERLDTHLRAVDRARATVSAQAAGARASALLLAAMPVAGVGLGYAIGVDSVPVLLRTPLGAACLVAAVALQLGGLAWAGRLTRVEVST
jgi:tight adherence protein B